MRTSFGRIILIVATIVLILAAASVLYLALINGHTDERTALMFRGTFAALLGVFMLFFDMKMLEPVAPLPALSAGIVSLLTAVILWLAFAPWPEIAPVLYFPALLFAGSCLGQWRVSGGRIGL